MKLRSNASLKATAERAIQLYTQHVGVWVTIPPVDRYVRAERFKHAEQWREIAAALARHAGIEFDPEKIRVELYRLQQKQLQSRGEQR